MSRSTSDEVRRCKPEDREDPNWQEDRKYKMQMPRHGKGGGPTQGVRPVPGARAAGGTHRHRNRKGRDSRMAGDVAFYAEKQKTTDCCVCSAGFAQRGRNATHDCFIHTGARGAQTKTGASADGPWGSAVPEAAGHTLRRHRPPSTQARFQLGEGAGELAVVGMTWTLQSDQWPACGAEHPEDRSPRAEGGRGRARPYSRRGCISARRDPGPAHVGLGATAGRSGLQAPRAPLRPQWGCRLGP